MVELKPMAGAELARVVEIDVSESGSSVYAVVAGRLVSTEEAWRRAPRSADDWRPYVEEWNVIRERGGAAIGAFADGRLVGIAVVRHRLTDSTAQLAALVVDTAHRRQGIAAALMGEVIRLARDDGARELYVSATPSASAVGFYTSQGFRLAERVNQELYEREPADIHMLLALT